MEVVLGLLRWIRLVLRMIWIVLDQIYSIPSYFLFRILFFPLRFISPRLYWAIDGYLNRILLLNVSYWAWTSGVDVVQYGDDISKCYDERCLVVVNHQGTADVSTLMVTMQFMDKVCDRVFWVMDEFFKIYPFGWVSWVRGDFFIKQGRETRDKQLEVLKSHMREYYWSRYRGWVVLFPEGGFFKNRYESNKRYAIKNGYPELKHSTLPRIGAVQALLEVSGPDALDIASKANGHTLTNGHLKQRRESWQSNWALKWVIDATIAYDGSNPWELWDHWFKLRPPAKFHVFYRAMPIKSIPGTGTEELQEALYKLWQEKDELLAFFSRHGRFPESADDFGELPGGIGESFVARKAHQLKFSYLGMFACNGFFVVCFVFHLFWISRLASGLYWLFTDWILD